MIPMLGLSIAMLLAFRTNRGFERYWLGAQQWTTLSSQLRHLSRIVWNGVQTPTPTAVLEKNAIMKLLYSVAVSTKSALRGKNAFLDSEFLSLLPRHLAVPLKRTGKLGLELIVSYKTSLVNVDSDDVTNLECHSDEEDEAWTPCEDSQRNISALKRTSTYNAPFDVIHRISFYLRRQREEARMDVEDTRVSYPWTIFTSSL